MYSVICMLFIRAAKLIKSQYIILSLRIKYDMFSKAVLFVLYFSDVSLNSQYL
jgi:hypothetical protein